MTLPPLLAIAEGHKARSRRSRMPAPKELDLHIAVAKLLKDHALPEWNWFHVPSGEHRDIRTAAKLKAMGVKRGIPDFVLISPYGSVRFLELKRLSGKLSDAQEEFRLWCIQHGAPHVVAWTMDQVLAALNSWRVLRVRIAPLPESVVMGGE